METISAIADCCEKQNCAGGLHELDCGIEIVPAGVFWKDCWHVFDCAGSNWFQRFQRNENYNCPKKSTIVKVSNRSLYWRTCFENNSLTSFRCIHEKASLYTNNRTDEHNSLIMYNNKAILRTVIQGVSEPSQNLCYCRIWIIKTEKVKNNALLVRLDRSV